jgi:predicted acyltransferase
LEQITANAHPAPGRDAAPTVARQRLASLDQFRGYTVVGMFLVNFVGSFSAVHYVLKHHNTFCSYADTIMPQFLFAVGFAFRLTFGRRVSLQGTSAAYARVVRRLLGLVLVALVVYTAGRQARTWEDLKALGVWEALRVPIKRDWFQTLMHIAVTSLWILPVIRSRAAVRIGYMAASALLHLVLSHWFYFRWVNGEPDGVNGIDGGVLGFLTWTIPAIVGTLAADLMADESPRQRFLPLVAGSILLMGLGYLISCGTTLYDVAIIPAVAPDRGEGNAPAGSDPADGTEGQTEPQAHRNPRLPPRGISPVVPPPEARAVARARFSSGNWREWLANPPFVPPPHPEGRIDESYKLRWWNYWMMSQRAGTISYLTFSAGFSLALYALFYVVCDRIGLQLGVFRTFGTNALAAYVLHGMVASAIQPFMTRDVPAWYLWSGCGLFMLITYLIVRSLEKQGIYIKL